MIEINPLIAQLTDSDVAVRRTAARALITLGDPAAAPALIAILNDGDAIMRIDVVTALGMCRSEAGMAALLKLVRLSMFDAHHVQAIRSLGWFRDARLAAPLLPLLAHNVGAVRLAAAEALGDIGDPSAVPALVERFESDPQIDIRWQAARSLGAIRDASAVPALMAALHDTAATIRAHAASALGAIGDRRAVNALRGAANDTEDAVRRAVGAALGQIETGS
ncbi:MAG: HEAT repeat domain-containing protein [Chloroflexota bacterium]|nr:HEAT repeat domain-containing protein [Chloroflexota bacterium]